MVEHDGSVPLGVSRRVSTNCKGSTWSCFPRSARYWSRLKFLLIPLIWRDRGGGVHAPQRFLVRDGTLRLLHRSLLCCLSTESMRVRASPSCQVCSLGRTRRPRARCDFRFCFRTGNVEERVFFSRAVPSSFRCKAAAYLQPIFTL